MPYAPGSGVPPSIRDLQSTCSLAGVSEITFSVNKQISGTTCTVRLTDDVTGNDVWSGSSTANVQAYTITGQPDGTYKLSADNGEADSSTPVTIACGNAPGGLSLSVAHTDETAAGSDGTITLTPSGGTAPYTLAVVELSRSQPGAAGTGTVFNNIPAGTYTVRNTDNAGAVFSSSVTVLAYTVPVTGCTDEYADNYDPLASADTTPSSCTYTPRWRSAWQPVAVRVAAVAGQVAAYIEAELRMGFRPSHPLAASRPLGDPLTLRATVGPDGYATFNLGPYLRPMLGAPDGAGGYRLDLNSATAYGADLYVGYELRRSSTAELLEHGYALNAAVPDAQLGSNRGLLAPFLPLPVWPGFDDYPTCELGARVGGLGTVDASQASDYDTISLPCPFHPLPVAWLAPGGGYGFWVFTGKPQLADVIADGQRYREALTGESRWSERGEARQQYTASSGPYRGAALAEGLATLARSPQVWVQIAGAWVPVTIEAGTFPVRQWGVQRNEISITFTEAAAWYAQGQ